MHQHTVYIYSFAPVTEEHTDGGFMWSIFRDEVEPHYNAGVRNSARHAGSHICRLLRITTPHNPLITPDALTYELEERLDELETSQPALRQYIPPHTPADWLPCARTVA